MQDIEEFVMVFKCLLAGSKCQRNPCPTMQLIMLDRNARLNLASFVTTWMELECDKLILQSLNKNYIDKDEYPVTTKL